MEPEIILDMHDLLNNMDAAAILTVRVILGILFFSQAYDKVFTVGLKEFNRSVAEGLTSSKVPNAFVRISTLISSYLELLGGVLLILGLFLPIVYLLLALNLIMVTLSFSYLKPLWDLKHVFPRLVMLVFLMTVPAASDIYNLSSLL